METENKSGHQAAEDADRAAEFAALEMDAGAGPVAPGAPMPGQDQAGPGTDELLMPILSLGFAVLAPAWAVSEPEVKELAAAYGGLIDKYFPDGIGQFGVEVNALLITGAVLMPRLAMPRKVEPPKPGQDKDQGAADGRHQ